MNLTISQAYTELKGILANRSQVDAQDILMSAIQVACDVPPTATDPDVSKMQAVQSARTLLLEGASDQDSPAHLVDCLESFLASAPSPAPAPRPQTREATSEAPARMTPRVPAARTIYSLDQAFERFKYEMDNMTGSTDVILLLEKLTTVSCRTRLDQADTQPQKIALSICERLQNMREDDTPSGLVEECMTMLGGRVPVRAARPAAAVTARPAVSAVAPASLPPKSGQEGKTRIFHVLANSGMAGQRSFYFEAASRSEARDLYNEHVKQHNKTVFSSTWDRFNEERDYIYECEIVNRK